MNSEDTRNERIKDYLCSLIEEATFIPEDAGETRIPNIQISKHMGKLLSILTLLIKPKKVLEIGTLSGYSALWLAKNLPENATILSLELYPHHAEIAKKNVQHNPRIEVRQGDAAELLPKIGENNEGPFDLLFIDADKRNYPIYLDWAIKLSKKGSVIISDNLIPKRGAVGRASRGDMNAERIYEFNELFTTHLNLESTIIPTIERNGRIDGIGIGYVIA